MHGGDGGPRESCACLDHRDGHSCTAGSPAVGPVSHTGRGSFGDHLDPGRARGDSGRRGRGGLEAKPRPELQQYGCRLGWRGLLGGCSGRRNLLRLADRPPRTQEAFFHYARRLPHGNSRHRPLMEFLELCRLSLSHWRRHRRGIRCHQLDDPGAHSSACARLDRSSHQRQFLAWRSAWRSRFDRVARPEPVRPGHRLALGVPDRRGARVSSSSSCACGCPRVRAG